MGHLQLHLAWPLSKLAAAVKKNNYPVKLEVGLIGSCTNSSYEDLTRAASIARQAKENTVATLNLPLRQVQN